MGFKLQDQIQQMRNIPGKYKRVLLAIAQRARNDGTNYYESKETAGQKAGVSRWTAYRAFSGMESLRALAKSQNHECSNKACPKGANHFTKGGNHWTQAYNLNLDVIFNSETAWRSILPHGDEGDDVAKRRKYGVAKRLKRGVAKCDAIQGVTTNHVSLGGATQSSALTGGSEGVSESVGEAGALASRVVPPSAAGDSVPSTPAMCSDSGPIGPGSGFDAFDPDTDDTEFGTPEPEVPESLSGPQFAATPRPPVALAPQSLEQMSDEELKDYFYGDLCGEPVFVVMTHLQSKPSLAAIRKGIPICEKILAHFDSVDPEYRGYAAAEVIKWNRAHRSGKYASKEDKIMYLRTPEQMLKALESENAILLNDYLDHNFEECETCECAGVQNYRSMIHEMIEKREQRERERATELQREANRKVYETEQAKRGAEQEAARKAKAEQKAAAEKAEAERLDRMCTICHEVPFGEMAKPNKHYKQGSGDHGKFCDVCWDQHYEIDNSLFKGKGSVKPRPGYLEFKATVEKEFDAWAAKVSGYCRRDTSQRDFLIVDKLDANEELPVLYRINGVPRFFAQERGNKYSFRLDEIREYFCTHPQVWVEVLAAAEKLGELAVANSAS